MNMTRSLQILAVIAVLAVILIAARVIHFKDQKKTVVV